jgi:hypothetical protein
MTTDPEADCQTGHHTDEPDDAGKHCPWCGHLISRQEFEEIRVRIEAEEREGPPKLDGSRGSYIFLL